MALSIKDPEADRLARELATRTGETLTQAVVVALRERLARETLAIPLHAQMSDADADTVLNAIRRFWQ